MNFDNVIIGGGLCGLTAGIKLAEEGKKCAIVSSGQSALHFFSGSFDLLGKIEGNEVKNPIESIKHLPDTHPYLKIGTENIIQLADEALKLLKRAGLNLSGDLKKNHYVLTPMGTMKPTWLTLNDFNRFEENNTFPWQKAIILNFCGFLDFHDLFVKDGLMRLGIRSEIKHISMKQFDAIRRNPSEMRSTNIAKVFDKGNVMDEFVQKVNVLGKDAEVVILPAVFGLFNKNVADELKEKVNKPVVLIPVVPPSVSGIRSQILLCNRFKHLGGTYFLGDKVEGGCIKGNHLQEIKTNNHGNVRLEADQFILASGSFFSKGLVATPHKIFEPIFGLDINCNKNRDQWIDENFFEDQPFMSYGVETDKYFHALKEGQPIENLYVAGSVIGKTNSMKENSGAGISLLTSLYVAEQILK